MANPHACARQLRDKAWGKPWPHQSSGKVSIAEMVSTDNDPSMLIEFDEDDDSVISTPTDWEYNCLHRIHEVVKACLGEVRSLRDVLVIRSEYRWLLETFEKGYLRTTMAIGAIAYVIGFHTPPASVCLLSCMQEGAADERGRDV